MQTFGDMSGVLEVPNQLNRGGTVSNRRFAGAVLFSAAVAMAVAGCGAGSGDEDDSSRLADQEQAAAGDTVNVCSSTMTPSGWVDVQWWNSGACGSTFSPNSKQMKDLTGYPIGTRVNACSSWYPPSGWSVVSSYYSSSCRYSAVPSFDNNSWTLVRSF
jgi:hypothetical protein